jgi:hypothetical protein
VLTCRSSDIATAFNDERELPGQHPKAGSRFGGYTFIGGTNREPELQAA